jgi:uncharacterized repeat protein (TIGR03803 family)
MKKLFSAVVFLLMLAAAAAQPAAAQKLKPLHEFNGVDDGRNPEGKLLRDAAGNLYGTTFTDGIGSAGTVFKIDSTGREKVLFQFHVSDGADPSAALIQDQAGNLYGVADEGPGGAGIVYKLSPEGKQTILFAFQGCLFCHRPRVPQGALFMDKAGNLYGTTVFGGKGKCQSGCGTIYRLDPAGKLHVLYEFSGGADGSVPVGPLVPDGKGNLYGVAQAGGDLSCSELRVGCGTVFRFARKSGKLNVLHTFHGADGATPQPDLLLDTTSGNLYGAASQGGTSQNGVLFKISSDGKYTILHRFTGTKDGSSPNGGLVLDEAGNLFGTAQTGGRGTDGTAFVINPAGHLKLLHTFNGGLDGAFPQGGLIRDEAGHLYGVAVSNGLIDQQNGDVFEITP